MTQRVYIGMRPVYIGAMAKHLVDIDEHALEMARTELGTTTIKDTVNTALRRATSQREQRVAAALDPLASAPQEDRVEAWR
jgi:Arc/MetJ family transcription regulator